jgi:phage terminase small subunit
MATGRKRRPGNGASRLERPPATVDVEALAAQLGITPERVLREYGRMAFANLRDFVEWDAEGLEVKPSKDLSDESAAAVAEIVTAASGGKPYRVTLHDKKPALDAIARYLGMTPPRQAAAQQVESKQDDGEDPREILARKIARLAAGSGAA